MKQHITVAQACESPYVFQKVMNRLGTSYNVVDGIIQEIIYTADVAQITIGTMIGILNECVYWELKHGNHMTFWLALDGTKKHEIKSEDDICDKLWEAVKEVL